MPRAVVSLTVLGVVFGLAACSEEESPVCDDLDSLRASMDTMRDATIGENALSTISSAVTEMGAAADQLAEDAAAEYAVEADAVKETTAALRTDLEAAMADPTAAALGEVGSGVQALGTALEDLVQKVGDTC